MIGSAHHDCGGRAKWLKLWQPERVAEAVHTMVGQEDWLVTSISSCIIIYFLEVGPTSYRFQSLVKKHSKCEPAGDTSDSKHRVPNFIIPHPAYPSAFFIFRVCHHRTLGVCFVLGFFPSGLLISISISLEWVPGGKRSLFYLLLDPSTLTQCRACGRSFNNALEWRMDGKVFIQSQLCLVCRSLCFYTIFLSKSQSMWTDSSHTKKGQSLLFFFLIYQTLPLRNRLWL